VIIGDHNSAPNLESWPSRALGFRSTTPTLLRRGRPDHWLRMLGGVGVLGAFTTFSTLANETALLGRDGHTATAVAYDAASLVGGVAAVVLGLVVAGWRYRPPLLDEGES